MTHIKAGGSGGFGQCAGYALRHRDMPTLSANFAAQHRNCESQLAAAQAALDAGDWDRFRRVLSALRTALLDHFWFEEEELFPACERAAGTSAQTLAFRDQHKQIRELLEALGAASPRHDPEGVRTEFGALATLVRQHAAEEERALYPDLERMLGSETGQAAQAAALPHAPAELDVRGLEPPEPFVRIMAALAQAPDAPLRVLIHREPLPLYDALEANGLRWHTRELRDGSFEILIDRAEA